MPDERGGAGTNAHGDSFIADLVAQRDALQLKVHALTRADRGPAVTHRDEELASLRSALQELHRSLVAFQAALAALDPVVASALGTIEINISAARAGDQSACEKVMAAQRELTERLTELAQLPPADLRDR